MNITKAASTLISLCAISVTGGFVLSRLSKGHQPESSEAAIADVASKAVRFSLDKMVAAGIQTEPVRRQTIAVTRTLPARFAYDDTRHVAVRAASDGILEAVLVKTGDQVEVGQTVAILRSPDVGAARSDVLSSEAKLAIAMRDMDWESKICDGVESATRLIREGNSIESIKQQLNDSTLGMYRGQLLSNYSKSLLTYEMSKSVGDVAKSGAISGRVVLTRESEQQQAQAELEASIEQALFETRQARTRAEAVAASARRDVLVARQILNTLIGATADATGDLDVSPNESNLSRLRIVSPLAGTIERKNVSATERVTADSELFTIADTSQLWVKADIRDRDWNFLAIQPGDPVNVTTPANTDVVHQAKVYFVGREVDPSSGAVPLVATIANPDQRFRPGLFARVEVVSDYRADVIAIPRTAVVDLDGQASVFVQEFDGFCPVAVEPGDATGNSIEIRSGLREGQQVVVAGAFVLKSALLLEAKE